MLQRRIVAVFLLAAAIAAALGLVTIRTNITTTYWDFSRKQSIATPPLVVLDGSVSDLACFGNRHCKVIAFGQEIGAYARDGIPRDLALWGGMVVPFLLATAAIVSFVRSLRNRKRAIFFLAAVPLFACGGALLIPLSVVIEDSMRQGSFLNLTTNEGPLMLFSIPGAALIAGSIWLSVRAFHSRA
jgi:hypothetical protein